jgi:uncharacterized membrane protein YbhN (UPF0104 family)
MNKSFKTKFSNYAQTISSLSFVKFIKKHKKYLAILVIVAFFGFFGFYIYKHPGTLTEISKISFTNVILILLLYSAMIFTNVIITNNTIRLCNKKLPLKNSIILTIYSSVINFFGPLQSGPAVRAVYLKSKLGLKIRDYTYVMLFYYFACAAINFSLLFIKNIPILTVLGIIVAITITVICANKFGLSSLKKYVLNIFIMAAVQAIIMTVIYTIELNTVNPGAHYNLVQTITYTASANLALFVSLTPGAIGIREIFLVLSQSIHNISLASIVAAGIIDRAIYVLFLTILSFVLSAFHLKSIFVSETKKVEHN